MSCGEDPIDSLEHPSANTPSDVPTSRLGAFFSWLITPLVHHLDLHYAGRFEDLHSRQISQDSSIRQLAAQAESSTEAAARLTAWLNLLEDLAGRNRQAMETLRGRHDHMAERLLENDDQRAVISRSIEALDESSKSAAKAIRMLKKVASRVETLEGQSVGHGDRINSLSESVEALDQSSKSAARAIDTFKTVAPRVKKLEDRSAEHGDQIDSLAQSVAALEETSKSTLETIDRHEQAVSDSHRLAQDLSASVSALEETSKSTLEAIARHEQAVSDSPRLAQDLDAARATLEKFEVQLTSALQTLEKKSDIETVSSVGDIQKRVLAHLAELQSDHDAVKLALTSNETLTRQLADRSEQLHVQSSDLVQTLADLQAATSSAGESAAAVAEIRDRVSDLAILLADAARERTILAEEMDRLTPPQDES